MTRYSVYDVSGGLVSIDQVGASPTEYIRASGMTLARVAGAAVTWLHPDHLGSAVAGTGPTGAVAWRESEQPFGEDWISAPANDNQPGYTGHVEDAATGLVYMQARYYDPVIGRFLANDPVGFSPARPDMFNRYAYAANDPVNYTDPTGMCIPDCKFFNFADANRANSEARMETAATSSGLDSPMAFGGGAEFAYAMASDGVMIGLEDAANAGANAALVIGTVLGPGDEAAAGGALAKTGVGVAEDVASSAMSRLGLQKQLASESQMGQLASGGGSVLSQPAKQADRIASQYGVKAADVQKVSSDSFKASDGSHIETHAFRDATTNELFEPKTVIDP